MSRNARRFVHGDGLLGCGAAGWLRTLAVAALLLPGSVSAQQPRVIEGEFLVGLRQGSDERALEKTIAAHGAARLGRLDAIGVLHIAVSPQAAANLSAALTKRPEVAFVEPNRLLPPSFVPDDPDYPLQWHLPLMQAPAAWDVTAGAGVTVAVLDSGVDVSHPDLASRIVGGTSIVGGSGYDDLTGHGTSVAGAAVAAGDNGTGVASVAFEASLLPVRVSGSDGWATDRDIADGLVWAVERGARVLNLSFATVEESSTISSAARYAMSRGGLVVAAAGNCACRRSTRDDPYILSVSATQPNDELASFSSYGPYVDVSAPGRYIYTTKVGGGTRPSSGTSFASPVAAGVAALLFSIDPSLTPQEVEDILERSADDLGGAGYDESYGYGRLDAWSAVAMVAGGAAPTPPDPDPVDAIAPEVAIVSPSSNSTVSGVVEVAVSANDLDSGVAAVELWIDGSLAASDGAPPWSFAWDSRGAGDGAHSLEALAVDAAGNDAISPAVDVLVQNGVSDTTAPSVSILSPGDGESVRRTLKIDVVASDASTIESIEVLVDGERIGSDRCGATTCSVRFAWNPRRVSPGGHVIEARASDASGNLGLSPAVHIEVTR
jgi:subtilisin family serine protease